ncbi:hypothetical protein Hanom_Chr06g00489491 [Helianthus anomalus]
MLLAPKAVEVEPVEPNKLVVVVVAVVPPELELDPNKVDPPNGEPVEEDDVVPNPNVEPVEAEEAPKPKEGAAEDGVEDEEEAKLNPKDEVEDADDDEGVPNVGLEGADDAPNSEGEELGFEENEKGDVDEDDANENGDGEDEDAGFVLKEKPAIVEGSRFLEKLVEFRTGERGGSEGRRGFMKYDRRKVLFRYGNG